MAARPSLSHNPGSSRRRETGQVPRKNVPRILALLGACVAFPAVAAPPSATVGQIEPRPSASEDAGHLGPQPAKSDLARTTQVSPDASVSAQTYPMLPPDSPPDIVRDDCFLGPQIARVAEALPLEGAGLGDVCLSLVWLESEHPARSQSRGVRSLQGVETMPAQPDPQIPPATPGEPGGEPTEPGSPGYGQPPFGP
jgi:hypothetical protein